MLIHLAYLRYVKKRVIRDSALPKWEVYRVYSREFARKVGDVGITDFHQARSKEAGELYYQDNDVQCEQVFGEGEREELLQKAVESRKDEAMNAVSV